MKLFAASDHGRWNHESVALDLEPGSKNLNEYSRAEQRPKYNDEQSAAAGGIAITHKSPARS
jgi:hypothetical protein